MPRQVIRVLSVALLLLAGGVPLRAQITSSQSQLAFSGQPVGTTSAQQSITINNSSSTSLYLGEALLSGSDATAFIVDFSACYIVKLAPGASCTVAIAFSPFRSGAHYATLAIGDVNGAYSTRLSLSGTATGTTPTYATPAYTVQDLTKPPTAPSDTRFVEPSDLNDHGEFAGAAYRDPPGCLALNSGSTEYLYAVKYSQGQIIGIGTFPGATTNGGLDCQPDSDGLLISNSGDVVGWSETPASASTGWGSTFVYTGGVLHDLQDFITDGTVLPSSERLLGGYADFQLYALQPSSGALILFDSGKIIPALKYDGTPERNGDPSYDPQRAVFPPFAPFVTTQGTETNRYGMTLVRTTNATVGILSGGVITDTGLAGTEAVAVGPNSQIYVPVRDATGAFIGANLWTRETGLTALQLVSAPPFPVATDLPNSAYLNAQGQILLTHIYDSVGQEHTALLTPQIPTPIGTNVQAQSGTTSLQFSAVTSSGTTLVQQIDPSTAGQVPGGFAVSDILAYQISTMATFSGSVTIGFVIPGPISQADFNNLRILHNQDGSLLDITSGYDYTRLTVYGTTNSFSPFYIARQGPHITPLFDQTTAYKSGSTIPIKLQVLSATNANLSSASLTVATRKLIRLQDATSLTVTDSGNSNPDNDFRYDSTIGSTGGYIFNLSTKGLSSGTYSLSMYVGNDKQYVYSSTFQVR